MRTRIFEKAVQKISLNRLIHRKTWGSTENSLEKVRISAKTRWENVQGHKTGRIYSAKLNDEVYDTQYAVSEYAVENWADDIVPPVVINSCIWAIVANTAAEMQKDNRFLRGKEICDTEFFEIATRVYNELLGFAARKYEILDIGE